MVSRRLRLQYSIAQLCTDFNRSRRVLLVLLARSSDRRLDRSGMRVGVIGTGGRLSIRTDAGAIKPRLDVATLPDSPAGALGITLSFAISALRVLRPIQRQALAHKPFAEIGAA